MIEVFLRIHALLLKSNDGSDRNLVLLNIYVG